MQKTKINIKNNVSLNVVQTDKFKMSRLSISFIYEADRVESPKRKLTYSTLMRGSKKYPTVKDINCALDDLYGSTVIYRFSSDGDRHVYTFVCEMLEDRYLPDGEKLDILRGTLNILGDTIFNPLLDVDGLLRSDYVESEKSIALDNIRAKLNDQRSYSASNCKKIMFKGEKCGIPIDGDVDIVSTFDNSVLTDCYKNIFDDVRVECFYIGSNDSGTMEEIMSDFFSRLPKSTLDSSYGYKPFISTSSLSYIEEKQSVTQGRLNIGMTCDVVMGEDDYYSMSLFNEIFGGNSTSKLFMNIREKKSLCYYCNSVYLVSKGAIFVACGVNPSNKDEAYREILYQLDQMKKGNITDDEIMTAKKVICGALKQVSDSAAGIDGFSFRRTMAGIVESPEDVSRRINAISREDIIRVAGSVSPHTVYFLYGEEDENE